MKYPTIGQEAIVPQYGLGRVVSYIGNTITVRPYMSGHEMEFDSVNVKLVRIHIDEGNSVKERRDAIRWLNLKLEEWNGGN